MQNKSQLKEEATFDPFSGPEIERVIHTTKGQSEILIDCLLGGDDAKRAYNLSFSLRFLGDLKFDALKHAVKTLVKRHESLRASFSEDRGFMCIFSDSNFEISYDDISNQTDHENQQSKDTLTKKDINYLFDLVNGPLFKVSLIKIKELEHLFTLTVHHSICDGLSIDTFMEELGILYSAYVQDKLPSLPDPDRFSLFAEKENLFTESVEYKQSEAFWLHMYQDSVPKVELPIDFPRPTLRTYNNHRLDFLLDNNLLNTLKHTGINAGSSLVTTLVTAFEILLYQQTGQKDLVVGLTNSRPAHYDMMQIIGQGVNVLPLRSKVDTKLCFKDYLKQRKTQLFDAYEHQSISFGHLLEKLSATRDPSRIPLVPVMLNLELNKNLESEISFFNLSHELQLNIGDYGTFEIELQAFQSKDGPCLRWKYNTTLFKPDTIKQMMSSFEELIEKLVSNPNKSISEIIGSDYRNIYNTLNNTKKKYSDEVLHKLIKNQAEENPEKLALVFQNKRLNYRHLQQQSNQLAHYFIEQEVLPGDFIAVSLPRCPELVPILLAIMQCGAAYLPLDPAYPKSRLEFMLKDSGAKFLVTTNKIGASFPDEPTRLIIEDILTAAKKQSIVPLHVKVNQGSIAYILYTSGSTGKPKGVSITHKNLVNFLNSMSIKPGIEETDELLSITTISFDIAGLELFLPLLKGATLVLADDDTARDGRLLLDLLIKRNISILQATPTTWQMLLDSGWKQRLPLKALCGGEAMALNLAQVLLSKCNSLWNMYGPTETTIWSTVKQVIEKDELITIGTPIDNTQIYILDDNGQLVSPDKIGEIGIAGDGVGLGYLKRPDLTAEKFISNPFSSEPQTKLFLTGDLGKLLPTGEIQCLGRKDQQVKIRGHRVELGEIEQALTLLNEINSAAVVADKNRLIAHIVLNEPIDYTSNLISQLKKSLKDNLPNHLIPQEFNILETLPQTLNGKIDRKALIKLEIQKNTLPNYIVPRAKSESIVADIWHNCLGIDKIDINSDFFEVGGHSLMAVKVMSLLEKQTGIRLPLASLIENPTIEKLAAYMDKRLFSWDSLVPLKPNGNKVPLFIVHGANHNILIYKNLAENLNDNQPVYALQAKGLSSEVEPHKSVEEMASHYISEIKTINPEGPYALGGFSFGGIIAFEMAKQLKAQGKKVKFLALFDCYVYPHYYYTKPLAKKIISALYNISQLIFMAFNMFSSVKNFKRRYDLLKLKFSGLYLRLKYGKEKQFQMQFNRSSKIDEMHGLAFSRYNLIPEAIKVDLFRSTKNIYFAHDYKYLGWKKIALGGIRKHMIPENHSEMFLPPSVNELSRILQNLLDKNE